LRIPKSLLFIFKKSTHALVEIPEETRTFIEKTRTISKEYTVLTASTKKITRPEEIDLEKPDIL